MSTVLPQRAEAGRPQLAPAALSSPKPLLLLLWHKAAFHGCLAILGALMLSGCALSTIFSLTLPQRYWRACGHTLISLCARTFFRIASALRLVRLDLSALDALNVERGLIIAPNHPSMLDVLLVVSRVRRTGCIMKADLWDNPFLGAGARLADYIRNDSINSMIRQAAAELKSGGKLLIFPEGTRTTRPPVNPLAGGIALIAQRAGVPIQTVLIETDSPYLGKGWPLFRVPQFPLCYRATLGPRFVVNADRNRTLAELQAFYVNALAHPEAARRFGSA